MELIRIENGTPILKAEISCQIADFERMVKKIEEQENKLKQLVLKEMEQKGIIQIDTPELTISYVAPYDRENFDKKAFREKHSTLYDDYVRMSTVNASIRIKVKEEK